MKQPKYQNLVTDHFIDNAFVGMKIEGETRIAEFKFLCERQLKCKNSLFLDQDPRSSFGGFGTYATLHKILSDPPQGM